MKCRTRSLTVIINVSICFNLFHTNIAMADEKKISIVHQKNVRLSDLFKKIGKNHDTELGPAPNPGEEYFVGPNQLTYIAKKFKIKLPASALRRGVLVKRPAHQISERPVLNAVAQALQAFNIPLKDIVLLPFKTPVASPGTDSKFSVTKIDYDSPSSRFSALVLTKNNENQNKIMKVEGFVKYFQRVLVASQFLPQNSVIKKTDVKFSWLPKSDSSDQNLKDFNKAVGKKVIFSIPRDKPILIGSLALPIAVKKGAVVDLFTTVPGASIQVSGIALSGGKIGSEIQVINPASHDVITALVTAPNQARAQLNFGSAFRGNYKKPNLAFGASYYAKKHAT